VSGVRGGRAVVTAAAIIMISVFGGFVFSELSMVRPLGFGLAFGVLFDAFVVRMLLVPGLMHLFGRAAWWLPRWLDRIVPDVDVEGAALERSHPLHGVPAEQPVRTPEPVAGLAR
jgi:RND superfamily putative drug exporter